MNDEREMRASDELVSRTYHAQDAEQAPERLNRTILAMAANKPRPIERFQDLVKSWSRPAALAATMALSFAIVLEITRLPEPTATPTAPAPSASDSLREEFRQKDSAIIDRAQDQARLRDGSNRDDSLVAEPQSILKLEKPSNQAERAQHRDLDETNTGEAVPTRQPAVSVSASRDKAESADATGCDASERATAKRWLACIDELKQSGARSEAEAEYAEYIRQFPGE